MHIIGIIKISELKKPVKNFLIEISFNRTMQELKIDLFCKEYINSKKKFYLEKYHPNFCKLEITFLAR